MKVYILWQEIMGLKLMAGIFDSYEKAQLKRGYYSSIEIVELNRFIHHDVS